VVGASVGIPAALLVINRRLYKIATRSVTFLTAAEKRRDLYIDLAICTGIPILHIVMRTPPSLVALHSFCLTSFTDVIVEGHRFDIFEGFGCYITVYNTPLAFPLVYIWPGAISLVTAVYACVLVLITSPGFAAHLTLGLNVRLFWKSSRELEGMLGSTKNPNHNRYVRLIALSSVQIFCAVPITMYNLYYNARVLEVFPWISWDDTHFNFSAINQYTADEWRTNPAISNGLELNRWFFVSAALVYFAFFGFAEEARKRYRLAYSFASTRLRLPEWSSTRASSSSPNTFASSFGPGIKKGMGTLFSFKGGFSVLGSRGSQRDTMRERKDSYSVSDHRLTSDASIFEGIDDRYKAMGILRDDDDALPAAAPLNVVVTMPAIPRVPVPSPPILNGAGLSIPPGRLNSPLPHRPTSSCLDVPEDV
jgi:pheromone a factor receptor